MSAGRRIDLLIVAGVFAVLLVESIVAGKDDGPVGFAEVVVIVGFALPLLWRRSHPEIALAGTMAMLFPVFELGDPYECVAIPPMIAGFSLALYRDRGRAVIGALAVVPVILLAIGIYSPHGIFDVETPKNLALVALPVIIGGAKRERRAYLQALHDRVETAERTREEEARRRVGEERLRIAREVHDVVAHSMVAINVQAGVAAHLIDRRPDAARDALTEIKRVSGEALGDLRATLGVLREDAAPAPVRPASGFDGIEELAGGLRAAGVAVAVDVHSDGRTVPSAVEAVGYRIVQEALTNVLRHAPDARDAGVRVAVGTRSVEIEVVDDGAGNGNGVNGTGNGLRGMHERAAAVGGLVEAGRRETGGWRVHATLPLA